MKDANGDDVKYNEAWILVDGGYPTWTTLICPFKDTPSEMEGRWSRWAESMREDVKCALGIMKGKKIFYKLQKITFYYIYLQKVIYNFCREMENIEDGYSPTWNISG